MTDDQAVRAWLRERGAEGIPHPGGDVVRHRPLPGVRPARVVNELDLVEQDPTVGERFGDYFREVFGSWAPVASAEVMRDARSVLATVPT